MPPSAPAPPPPPRPGGSDLWRSTGSAAATATSLGLTRRQAELLAYSAGWISGLVLLTLEGRDAQVRWHAAQSFIGFGLLTALTVGLLALAALSLFTSLTLFRVFLWAAQGVIVVGLLLWLWSLAQVVLGHSPRWPLIGRRVARLAGTR